MRDPLERKLLLDQLARDIPAAVRTSDGVMIAFEHGFYHVTDILDETCEGFKKYGNDWHYYQPICNENDIGRILRPQNANDFLLDIRAQTVLDKPRLLRVFRKRFNNSPNLSISSYYEKNTKNDEYLNNISKGNRTRLSSVPAGSALIEKMNASCIKSKFGNVIVISEPLEYFLYYMSIFIYGKHLGFDVQDAYEALVIGLRIYFGYEALDFDLDPRGEFSCNTQYELARISSLHYSFILGHEYGHHLLGHLSDAKLKTECFISNSSGKKLNLDHYVHRFKEEYDADWHAIKCIKGNSKFKGEVADAAFTFLLSLHAAQRVDDFMNPRGSNGYKSHPDPVDRIWKIRSKLDNKLGLDRNTLESCLDYVNKMVAHFLTKDLPFCFEEFEAYGSKYFTNYKKRKLIDRLDY